MIKRLALGSLVLALAGVLALGMMSALAGGGSVGRVAEVVTGDDDDGARTEHDAAGNGADAIEAQDEGEPGQGAQAIAQVIADEFGVSQEEVLALHEEGIGFGALFKLYAIAAAKGISVSDLLATIPTNADGERAFAFGKMMKGLTEDEMAALEAGPKNLGQLVSASHKSEGGAEEGEASEAGSAAKASRGQGQGLPEFAQAHGRR